MELTYIFGRPNRKIARKETVCSERYISYPYDTFPVLSDLAGNGKRVLRTGFSNRNFFFPFTPFETRWVFGVNHKQPLYMVK